MWPGLLLNVRFTLLFLSAQHLIVKHRHCVVQQVSRTYSSYITVTLHPLNNNSPSLLYLLHSRLPPRIARDSLKSIPTGSRACCRMIVLDYILYLIRERAYYLFLTWADLKIASEYRCKHMIWFYDIYKN